jgi:ribonuclease HII
MTMGIGIDEAGRGPVLGPLVVCALFSIDPSSLKRAGARDSKVLYPRVREELEVEFSCLPHSIVVISAACIDEARVTMTMNDLEVHAFASALSSLIAGKTMYHPLLPQGCLIEVTGEAPPCDVWMDAADVDEVRFTERVRNGSESLLLPQGYRLTGKHKADSIYPEVSASSIIAKVRRDREIELISREMGEDIGSGYPSDRTTIAYMESFVKREGILPPHARKSWDTSLTVLSRCGNRSLSDF